MASRLVGLQGSLRWQGWQRSQGWQGAVHQVAPRPAWPSLETPVTLQASTSSPHQMQLQRRRRRHARPHAHPAPHTPLGVDHGPASLIQAQGGLAHRTYPRAGSTGDTLEHDAPLRHQFEGRHVHALPNTRRALQGLGGTGCGAQHVLADDARLHRRIDERRSRCKAQTRRRSHDGMCGAHIDAVSAARARREECHLVDRTWRSKQRFRRDPSLGASRHFP